MTIKSKIIIFLCAFALLFSLLTVSCFALVDELVPGNRYTPCTDLSLYPSEVNTVPASFSLAGEFSSYVDIQNSGLVFLDSEYQPFIGFLPNLGWVDVSTGSLVDIEFVTFNAFSGDSEQYDLLCSVLDDYIESDPDSFYNQIFNSISGAVFGEDELTPEQNLSLSLISTVLSISVVLLPVLLACGWILRVFRL